MTKRTFYRLVWMVSALAIVGMSVYFPLQPQAQTTADQMVPYTTQDKSLSFLYPGNWKPNEASQGGTDTGVEFVTHPNVRIVIRTTLKDSLMSDVAASGNAGLGNLPGLPSAGAAKNPLETIHDLQKDRMERDHTTYRDFADGSTKKIQVVGVEGLETAFTYQKINGFFQKETMVGRRISALVGGRGLSIVETYPSESGSVVQPVFDKMLASLSVKEPGG